MVNSKTKCKGARNVKILFVISSVLIVLGLIMGLNSTEGKTAITAQEFITYVTNNGMEYTEKTNYYKEYGSEVKVYNTKGESKLGLYPYELNFLIINNGNIDEFVKNLKGELKENYGGYRITKIENTILYATCDNECSDKVRDHFKELNYDDISLGGILFGFGFAIIGFMTIAGIWRIFEKAGKKGYTSLIPIYSNYQIAKITFDNGWLFILLFIPIVGIIYHYVTFYCLAKRFNKSTEFSVGNAIIPLIFIPIIAFDESVYR